MATISSLTYYPVKGCAGVSVQRAELTGTGLRHDRQFMVVDAEDGGFFSQRKVAAMAAIRVAVVDDGARLRFSAAGADDAEVDVVADGTRLDVNIFGTWFGTGIDQGDLAAKWLSAVLDKPVRLVRVPPDHDRDGHGVHPGKAAYGDAHAVLVASDASLDHLNERILERGAEPVPMNRFRPNIVVTGWDEPHTEDEMRRMTVGTAELGFSAKAGRCQVPTIDQETGAKAGPEPIRTLASYRREEGRVVFGAKAAVLTTGWIAVGDEITVHEWRDPELEPDPEPGPEIEPEPEDQPAGNSSEAGVPAAPPRSGDAEPPLTATETRSAEST